MKAINRVLASLIALGLLSTTAYAQTQSQHIECPTYSAQIPVNPIQDQSWTLYTSTIAKVIETSIAAQGNEQPTLVCTYQHDLGVFTSQKPAPANMVCKSAGTGFDCTPGGPTMTNQLNTIFKPLSPKPTPQPQ
jgi:hypothetical protein